MFENFQAVQRKSRALKQKRNILNNGGWGWGPHKGSEWLLTHSKWPDFM